jgi:hypothetical protein
MVKRSLRKLGEFLIALDSRQAKGPASGSPGDRLRRTRSQSDERIRRIVERHKKSGSPLVAGAVHLLGMQDIQKTPGAATNAVATEAGVRAPTSGDRINSGLAARVLALLSHESQPLEPLGDPHELSARGLAM